jgi:hypothetical protein
VRPFCIVKRTEITGNDFRHFSCTCQMYRRLTCGISAGITGSRGAPCPHLQAAMAIVAGRVVPRRLSHAAPPAGVKQEDFLACLPLQGYEDPNYYLSSNLSQRKGVSPTLFYLTRLEVFASVHFVSSAASDTVRAGWCMRGTGSQIPLEMEAGLSLRWMAPDPTVSLLYSCS